MKTLENELYDPKEGGDDEESGSDTDSGNDSNEENGADTGSGGGSEDHSEEADADSPPVDITVDPDK